MMVIMGQRFDTLFKQENAFYFWIKKIGSFEVVISQVLRSFLSTRHLTKTASTNTKSITEKNSSKHFTAEVKHSKTKANKARSH